MPRRTAHGRLDHAVGGDPKRTAWLVANPGSIPELHHYAKWLDAQSKTLTYIAPLTASRFVRHSAPLLSDSREIKEVDFHGVNTSTKVLSRATGAELAFQAARRLMSSGVADRALRRRTRIFDARVAKLIQQHPPTFALVRSTAALRCLQTLKDCGSISVLDYPIAHHAWLNAQLQEEVERYPELADTLVRDIRCPEEQEHLDQEILLSDYILTLSQQHRMTFEHAGVPTEKILTIPLGVDLSIFSPPPSRRNGKNVLFVGQMTQRKGLAYLLEAFLSLPSDYALTLVGYRPFELPPRFTHPRVTIINSVSRTELNRFYQISNVFVFPSLGEGFPQTPLEAMATGLPPIVSDVSYGPNGPIEDGHNGFVVNPRNPEQIAQRIRAICSDDDLARTLGANAVSTAQRYSWDDFASSLYQHPALRVLS